MSSVWMKGNSEWKWVFDRHENKWVDRAKQAQHGQLNEQQHRQKYTQTNISHTHTLTHTHTQRERTSERCLLKSQKRQKHLAKEQVASGKQANARDSQQTWQTWKNSCDSLEKVCYVLCSFCFSPFFLCLYLWACVYVWVKVLEKQRLSSESVCVFEQGLP